MTVTNKSVVMTAMEHISMAISALPWRITSGSQKSPQSQEKVRKYLEWNFYKFYKLA